MSKQELFKAYFTQLTKGCGDANCTNKAGCATAGASLGRSAAAAEALKWIKDPSEGIARLCHNVKASEDDGTAMRKNQSPQPEGIQTFLARLRLERYAPSLHALGLETTQDLLELDASELEEAQQQVGMKKFHVKKFRKALGVRAFMFACVIAPA